jgi:hypothetical protein
MRERTAAEGFFSFSLLLQRKEKGGERDVREGKERREQVGG